MILERRGMSRCKCVMYTILAILIAQTSSAFAGNSLNSQSQNAINPRNSSTETPTGGETCELSNTNSFAKSPCRMPCEKDDDCINHGRHTCCPTLPGSSCIGECLRDNLKSNGATKTCIDVRRRKRYIVGETFIRDKCCTCLDEGINCVSTTVKICYLGCWKNSKYFRHGESISSRSCYNCSCHNGSVTCSSDVKCLLGKCSYRGKLYEEGALFHLQGGCKECVCRSGRWNCNALTCNAAKSKADIPSPHHTAHSQNGFLSTLSLFMYTLFMSFCG
ncbi:kielin/chordin-like protein [Orbicella faveolata]|uniref:kielin/chordin-like protein n=1 Tax=Orbicella faveolata TaxID=48498 RepID=UPI0009E56F53|nr:kielin/chordin-like protein [Orbicella faveolata]